jgi:hypothetical protein
MDSQVTTNDINNKFLTSADELDIEAKRRERLQELKMRSSLREISIGVVFLIILTTIAYSNTGGSSVYKYGQTLDNLFSGNEKTNMTYDQVDYQQSVI